jgi:hypothetical protein
MRLRALTSTILVALSLFLGAARANDQDKDTGRVARDLYLTLGCPVLAAARAGLLIWFSMHASVHGVDANQPGFLPRLEG